MAKLAATRAQRTGQTTLVQTAAHGEALFVAIEEPQTPTPDQDMEPSWADMISDLVDSGKITPTKGKAHISEATARKQWLQLQRSRRNLAQDAAMEPSNLSSALESAHEGAVCSEPASGPSESPTSENPALPEPGSPATHGQREVAAQHLQYVEKLHAELRDAMTTKAPGAKDRASVLSKGRDHAPLDGEEKEASEQSATDIDTDSDTEAGDALPPVARDAIGPDVGPSIKARRDAARAEEQARVDARTAERIASLRGLPTRQLEVQVPPSTRSQAHRLGPIARPTVASN